MKAHNAQIMRRDARIFYLEKEVMRLVEHKFAYDFFLVMVFPIFLILTGIAMFYMSGLNLVYPYLTNDILEYWTLPYTIYVIVIIIITAIRIGPRLNGDL